MSGNLHKSEAGWTRFRARTDSGSQARRAHMEARPAIVKARRERAAKSRQPVPTGATRYFRNGVEI